MNILLSIPFGTTISNETLKSCEDLKSDGDFNFKFAKHKSIYIANNRNNCCFDKNGLLEWPDWFLWCDSDMKFTIDHIRSMISRGVDIIGGAYAFKEDHLKHFLVAGNFMEGYPGISRIDNRPPITLSGLLEMDWVGGGFLGASKKAMKKMIPGFPWFHHRTVKAPAGEWPFEHTSVGEDIGFCMLAREYGFKVYLDADIRIGHINTEARMEKQDAGVPANIDQMAMGVSRALMDAAESYRKLVAIAGALKAENEKLKADIEALKATAIHEDPKA